jgi:hypothetical protein
VPGMQPATRAISRRSGKVLARAALSLLKTSAGLSAGNAEGIGDSHQIGERLRPDLFHDVVTVDLHGDLAQADLRGNLLVHEADRHQCHDLLLARAERLELDAQVARSPVVLLGADCKLSYRRSDN